MDISAMQWDQECSHDNSTKQYKEIQLKQQYDILSYSSLNLKSSVPTPNLFYEADQNWVESTLHSILY